MSSSPPPCRFCGQHPEQRATELEGPGGLEVYVCDRVPAHGGPVILTEPLPPLELAGSPRPGRSAPPA